MAVIVAATPHQSRSGLAAHSGATDQKVDALTFCGLFLVVVCDRNNLLVLIEFGSMAEAKAFANDPSLEAAMSSAGVIRTPVSGGWPSSWWAEGRAESLHQ